jgi:gamma-glutamyl-gamma-aminobutyrate hydrolase PuuD
MKLVAVTQRVDVAEAVNERRDGLDQRWAPLLHRCGLLAVPMPNDPGVAESLWRALPFAGLVLTGGNTPVVYGGNAPERDATEEALIAAAIAAGLPVFGVCRGMQVLQHRFGVTLAPVEGHVTAAMGITRAGAHATVNSYHTFGARESTPDLDVWAVAPDGVIKAVRHRSLPVLAVMWHPERCPVPDDADLALIRAHFGTAP